MEDPRDFFPCPKVRVECSSNCRFFVDIFVANARKGWLFFSTATFIFLAMKDRCFFVAGKTYESIALEKFQDIWEMEVSPSGLFIHTEMSFLAASPDGCIYKDGRRIICEVKCPYNGRNEEIMPGIHFQFLEEVDGGRRLKRNHNYYYQIMGQLAIARSQLCYFIVYTHKDFFVEAIEYDSDFFEQKMFPLLNSFYQNHYKPYITQQM